MTVYLGIDNGVSGSIGVIYNDQSFFFKTPTKMEQDYTKKKKNISRIDVHELNLKINGVIDDLDWKGGKILAVIERPMVNPGRFAATTSAVRALESTLIFIEYVSAFAISYQFIDSKEWQKSLLPKGLKGSAELKVASKHIGNRLFPNHTKDISKHGDADGLLIAEYAKRVGW